LNTSEFTPYGVSQLNIASLPIGASINASITYQASKLISNGTYSIPISVSYKSGLGKQYSKMLNLTESIALASPQVRLSFSNPTPQALYQGYNQTVQLAIQNIGNGVAKNVSVDLRPGRGANLLSSVDSFFVATLQPGQTVYEPVLISASGSGNVSVDAELSYSSANYGSNFSSIQVLNLSLAPAAQFSITGGQSSLVPGSTNLPIVFTVKNTGSVAAQQVQLNMQSTYPITPIASTYYINDLAPGASANVTFLVSVDSQGVPSTYPISIYEQWKQPNGAVSQQFAGSNNYFVVVTQAAGVSGTTMAIVIIIVVIIVAYVISNRLRSRQKGKPGNK